MTHSYTRKDLEALLDRKYGDVTLTKLLKHFIELKEQSRALLTDMDKLVEALEELSTKEYPAVGFRMDVAKQALKHIEKWRGE